MSRSPGRVPALPWATLQPPLKRCITRRPRTGRWRARVVTGYPTGGPAAVAARVAPKEPRGLAGTIRAAATHPPPTIHARSLTARQATVTTGLGRRLGPNPRSPQTRGPERRASSGRGSAGAGDATQARGHGGRDLCRIGRRAVGLNCQRAIQQTAPRNCQCGWQAGGHQPVGVRAIRQPLAARTQPDQAHGVRSLLQRLESVPADARDDGGHAGDWPLGASPVCPEDRGRPEHAKTSSIYVQGWAASGYIGLMPGAGDCAEAQFPGVPEGFPFVAASVKGSVGV